MILFFFLQHVCIALQHVIAMIMLIPDSSEFSTLVNYFSFAAWLSYFAVFMALLYLRWKRPNADRPYKVFECIDLMHKWQPIYYSFSIFVN